MNKVSMRKILIVEGCDYSKKALANYAQVGQVIIGFNENDDYKDVEVVVVRLGYKIDCEFLKRFTSLKYLITPTTGLTHIELEACKAKEIDVISLRNCAKEIQNVTSTVEIALLHILNLLRKYCDAVVQTGLTNTWNRNQFKGNQLSGKTVGIIGYGRIGQRLGKVLHDLGAVVCFFDIQKIPDASIGSQVTFETLLENSDIISINMSYDKVDLHMVSQTEISKMKKGVLICNTARGELVDEDAILNGLDDGTIAGYATDVLQNESEKDFLTLSPIKHALSKKLNVVLTPHIGGCTIEAMQHTEIVISNYFVGAITNV